MNKKIFITILMFSVISLAFCSYSFAENSAMDNAKNAVMSAGNSIGNAAATATDTVVDGTRNLVNGATTLGNDAVNGMENMGNDAGNAVGTTLDNTDGDYTATRTATNNDNLLGMSDNTWTWLILGIVGIAIVGLVWYYGAQYEHRNYSND